MKKLIYILLILVLGSAKAQQMGSMIMDIKSADTLYFNQNLALNVFTFSGESDSVVLKEEFPKDWKILSKAVYQIAVNAHRYFFLIAPNKSVKAGDYQLSFRLNDLETEIRHVVVAPQRELRLTPLVSPAYVKEGDTLRASFLLENLGNTEEEVQLNSSSSVIFGQSVVRVPPQSSFEIMTYARVAKTELSSWNFSTHLIAKDENGKAYHAFSSTPVYTNRIIKADPYLRLPVYVGAGVLHYNSAIGPVTSYQYIVNGEGYLDDHKQHYIRMDFRGPNQLLFPAIGSYDNYSLKYVQKGKYEVELGDYQNYVSNLMEYSRYGRGFKGTLNRDQWDYSVFYHNARFFPGQRGSFGGQVTHQLKPSLRIQGNLMNKTVLDRQEWLNATLGGANLFFASEKVKLDAELATSFSKRGSSGGLSSRFSFITNKWAINSTIILSGQHFFGFYSNGRQLAHSVYYNLNSKISLGASSNQSRINPGFDLDDFRVSPYSSNRTFFGSYRLSNQQSVMLNYTRQETEDRRDPSTFHYKESFSDFSHNLDSKKFKSQTQLRVGAAENLLAETDNSSSRLGYSAMFQPSVKLYKDFWIGSFFQYQHTNKFSSLNELEDLYFYGADLRGNVSEKLSFSFSFRNNFAPDELFERRSFLDAYLNWEHRNSKVEFRAGKSYLPGVVASNQNTLFLSLRFTRRLNVPVRKNKDIGHLKGRLKGDGNAPVSNQMIQLGQYRTVTDEEGNFYFSNLKPDLYYISLPTEAMQPGLTMKETAMKPVQLVSDSVAFVEVELIKTGGVEGNIKFEIGDKYSVILNQETSPQAMVKLYGDDFQLITLSGKDGSFSFKDIRPGEYKLMVSLINESTGMEVVEQERTVVIKSEELHSEYFLVRSNKRKVKFTDQEFRLSSNK